MGFGWAKSWQRCLLCKYGLFYKIIRDNQRLVLSQKFKLLMYLEVHIKMDHPEKSLAATVLQKTFSLA